MALQIPSLSAGSNFLINPGFNVNQQQIVSPVVLAAGVYGLDMWKGGAAGATHSFATVNGVTTVTISAGSLVQIIEGQLLIPGVYRLTWEGTAQAQIDGGGFQDSGIIVTVAGGANVTIEFGTGTVSKPQFLFQASGNVYTPRFLQEEQRLCFRYFQQITVAAIGTTFGAGVTITTTSAIIDLPTRGPMTDSPAFSFSNLADWTIRAGGGTHAISSLDSATIRSGQLALVLSIAAPAFTNGFGAMLRSASATAFYRLDGRL